MPRFVAALILLLFSESIFSCSCSLGDVKQKFDEAKNVFLGQVNSITYTGERNSLGDKRTKVSFSVSKAWKGEGSEIILDTADNKVSCSGYWFEKEHTYIVYAYEKSGKLGTYYCGGVIPESLNDAFQSEIAALDRIGQ